MHCSLTFLPLLAAALSLTAAQQDDNGGLLQIIPVLSQIFDPPFVALPQTQSLTISPPPLFPTNTSASIITPPPLTSTSLGPDTSLTTITTSAPFNNNTVTMTSRLTTGMDTATRTDARSTSGRSTVTTTPIAAGGVEGFKISFVSLRLVFVAGLFALA